MVDIDTAGMQDDDAAALCCPPHMATDACFDFRQHIYHSPECQSVRPHVGIFIRERYYVIMPSIELAFSFMSFLFTNAMPPLLLYDKD